MRSRPTPRNPAMPRDIYCAGTGTVEPRHAAASNQGKLSVHAWPAICATGVPVRGYWWVGLSSRTEGDCPCSFPELSFLPAPRVSRAPFSRDHRFPTRQRQSIKHSSRVGARASDRRCKENGPAPCDASPLPNRGKGSCRPRRRYCSALLLCREDPSGITLRAP
jgi:hypothetical protein